MTVAHRTNRCCCDPYVQAVSVRKREAQSSTSEAGDCRDVQYYEWVHIETIHGYVYPFLVNVVVVTICHYHITLACTKLGYRTTCIEKQFSIADAMAATPLVVPTMNCYMNYGDQQALSVVHLTFVSLMVIKSFYKTCITNDH